MTIVDLDVSVVNCQNDFQFVALQTQHVAIGGVGVVVGKVDRGRGLVDDGVDRVEAADGVLPSQVVFLVDGRIVFDKVDDVGVPFLAHELAPHQGHAVQRGEELLGDVGKVLEGKESLVLFRNLFRVMLLQRHLFLVLTMHHPDRG